MCVCMCVRLCVCGSAAAQTDGSILNKFSANDLTDICEILFFSDFEIVTSWRLFVRFPLRHSHGRNFALIVFKI